MVNKLERAWKDKSFAECANYSSLILKAQRHGVLRVHGV